MQTSGDTEVLIVGGGPAGSATAIWLAEAGVRVVIVEQHEFPRQKVCGECVSAGALALLDELGIGSYIRAVAGPEIRQVGWMGAKDIAVAPFPRRLVGDHPYGRAIARDTLDGLLMARARRLGVQVIQPACVQQVAGEPGRFTCWLKTKNEYLHSRGLDKPATSVWRARVVIDAHGSWANPLRMETTAPRRTLRPPMRASDLFAFKTTFSRSTLPAGLLPVIAFPGGYGGIVVANDARTTLACCIRRDALSASRAAMPGKSAGYAVAATLRRSCRSVAEALSGARQETAWLSVGPIRPGVRVDECRNLFRVGNAAGESHPLTGEGINMALCSARLAAVHVTRLIRTSTEPSALHRATSAYATQWRATFESRLRYARWYAHVAMRPSMASPLNKLLHIRPTLMSNAARWAGKCDETTPAERLPCP